MLAELISRNFETPDGRTVGISDIIDTLRGIASQSVLSSGKIFKASNNSYNIKCNFQTNDCDENEIVKTHKLFDVVTEDSCIKSISQSPGILEASELLSSSSKNGRYHARLKLSYSKGESTPHQLLQIWNMDSLLRTINISKLSLHGDVCVHPSLMSFSWCPFGDQDKLLYVCEYKKPKSEPLMSYTNSQELSKEVTYEEYVKTENWGEDLTAHSHTIVGLLSASKDCEIDIIDYPNHSLADPQWLDGGAKIVSVAYDETHRRKGLKFCNNRKAKLVLFNLNRSPEDGPIKVLDSPRLCYHSPRVTNSGLKFVFQSNQLDGVHNHGTKFVMYDLFDDSVTELPNQEESSKISMPIDCFSRDDQQFFFTYHYKHLQKLAYYCLKTNCLCAVRHPYEGVSLLDVYDNILLTSGSDFIEIPVMYVGIFNGSDEVEWERFDSQQDKSSNPIVRCTRVVYQVPTTDGSSFVKGILITPESSDNPDQIHTDKSLPTIIFLHGGPHSTFSITYSATISLFSSMGFRSLLINYRGSTGIDEDYTRSLSGFAGYRDVDDCMELIRILVQTYRIDKNSLALFGGSHGGFLACHLCCQKEFRFTSAVIINPVVDLTTIYATSDIPDWSFNVALGQTSYEPSWLPSIQDIRKLRDASPMFKDYIANVPTLMLLGSDDCRVNMYQGERWVDLLRSRGVETLCKIYPDGHSLSKHLLDASIHAIIWTLNYLQE